jgi:hypothetical protein
VRPVPWFYLWRVVLSVSATVAWGVTYPHTPVWELFLVCLLAIAGLEGLRLGYRSEQAQVLRRRRGSR